MDLVNSNPSDKIITDSISKIESLSSNSIDKKNTYNYSDMVIANLSNRWIELETEIQNKYGEMKVLKSEKSQIEDKLYEFLDKNNIKHIDVEKGSIELQTKKKKECINEKFVKNILTQKHPGIVERIFKDLYEERKEVLTKKIIKK